MLASNKHIWIRDTSNQAAHSTGGAAFHLQCNPVGYKVELTGAWADPEVQFGIYARFA